VDRVNVIDAAGKRLSATSPDKAQRLVDAGKAARVSDDPPTIQLAYAVPNAPTPHPRCETGPRDKQLGEGRRILLHVCCAPCATYTVARLREHGFAVTGYWYNPNVHPFSEHERRRETLADYAAQIDLPMIWEEGYEVLDFMRAIQGQEQFRVRCKVCYHMRLERAATTAAREGFDAFTTTLLISPYQDQAAIRAIGERLAALYGVDFYFENLRRGWAEHHRLTREAELYSQRYCGCLYSEWEALDRQAVTLPSRPASRSHKG